MTNGTTRFFDSELVPWLEAEFPLNGERYLAGRELRRGRHAVSPPWSRRDAFDGLLLQSGSFAGAGTGAGRARTAVATGQAVRRALRGGAVPGGQAGRP